MAEQVYDQGDTAPLSVTFTVDGVATDPTTIAATVKKPDDTTTSYTSGQITHDSTGNYHIDVALDQSGEWSYKFVGTGTAADVGTGIFYVKPDPTGTTPRLYASVDSIKEQLVLTGQTNIDPVIARQLEAASRAIDRACGRVFYPLGTEDDPAIRYLTADICYGSGVRLYPGDIQSVDSLTLDVDGDGVYETEWVEGTDFYLDPSDASERSEPYTELVIRWRSGRRFPTWQRAIKVSGVFGWALAPPGVVTFCEIFTKRLVSRVRDNTLALGLVPTGNDIGTLTRLARTDPDFDLLVGDYVKIGQLIA